MCWKLFLLLVSLCGCAYCQEKSGYDGQPGCKTYLELHVMYYRNFWDPTAYWRCTRLDVPGEPRRCYDGYAFMTSRNKCVEWFEWRWEPERLPPSFPGDINYPMIANPPETMNNPVNTKPTGIINYPTNAKPPGAINNPINAMSTMVQNQTPEVQKLGTQKF